MTGSRHLTAVDGGAVFDLNAAVAEKRAGSANFKFDWDGLQYELTPMEQLPMDIAEEADTGRLSAVLKAIEHAMGPEQYAEFRNPDKAAIGIDAANILVEQWRKHGGLSQGESGASSPSSARTGTRSRPTSSVRAGGSKTSRRKAGG